MHEFGGLMRKCFPTW